MAWANHRLLTACAGLSPDEFVAKTNRLFFSEPARQRSTMCWSSTASIVDAMEGRHARAGGMGRPGSLAGPLQRSMRRKQRSTGVCSRWWKAWTAPELGRIVAVHRATSIQHERIDRLLLHLFQHQVHSSRAGSRHAERNFGEPTPSSTSFFPAGEAAVAGRRGLGAGLGPRRRSGNDRDADKHAPQKAGLDETQTAGGQNVQTETRDHGNAADHCACRRNSPCRHICLCRQCPTATTSACFRIEPETGAMTPVETAPLVGVEKPGSSTPLAVSPDHRFLFAGPCARSLMFAGQLLPSMRKTGRLKYLGSGPLADSMAYIADRSFPASSCSAPPTAGKQRSRSTRSGPMVSFSPLSR